MSRPMGPAADKIVNGLRPLAAEGGDALVEAIERLSAPIYITDQDGFVTHFNRACIGFTGRTPITGKDRWCVTWKLHTTDGRFLPHEACPMAVAIKKQEEVRGVFAVAERPNGTRVMFLPYPTLFYDSAQELKGAINILIDVTDMRQVKELRLQAERCGLQIRLGIRTPRSYFARWLPNTRRRQPNSLRKAPDNRTRTINPSLQRRNHSTV